MNRKYRLERNPGYLKWKFRISYSYFGCFWTPLGLEYDTEKEADAYFEEFLKPKK